MHALVTDHPGDLSPMHASMFALVIGGLGATILYVYVNTLTMVLTIASLIGYAFIYTVYLKRATPQNIVIGGLDLQSQYFVGLLSSNKRYK